MLSRSWNSSLVMPSRSLRMSGILLGMPSAVLSRLPLPVVLLLAQDLGWVSA